jgi:hypothetical protein
VRSSTGMALSEARIAARLPAVDLERARRWSVEKVELEPVEERPGGLRYVVGGAPAGGRLSRADRRRPSCGRPVEPWGLVGMWIEDPDGVRIVLVEVPDYHLLRRDHR